MHLNVAIKNAIFVRFASNFKYRKTIDHSSNCGNISRYICLICFGQKKNTVEAYFTNSSLQSRDSFPGIQAKLDLITPKSNTVSEFNVIDRHT